eukprot:TRINITY_DN582_c0_g1_i1.p2 TRINITY_DN582_c0_g1~~TRINITY_DN582_c0_g1_i1.p2  ORF type:complete len:138 (-),score=37.33 TRINITY_DN582_c0_g1_i1:616-993(-)
MSDMQQLIREHRERTAVLKEENEARVKEVLASVNDVSNILVDEVNHEISEVFNNQHSLEVESKELQAQTQRFLKQTQNWIALFDQFNKSLKELGDVSNWARMIETDVKQVVGTMEYICQKKRATL